MPRVELLFFDDCPNHEALVPHVRALLQRRWPETQLQFRAVESEEDARRVGFLGSPTVRVDGRDVEPGAEGRDDFGLKCRLYRVGDRLAGTPPDAWIVDALEGRAAGLTGLRTRSALNRLEDVSAVPGHSTAPACSPSPPGHGHRSTMAMRSPSSSSAT